MGTPARSCQQLFDDQLDRRTHITRELSLIEARETRLVEAIKGGDAVEPLVAARKDEEKRKKALAGERTGRGSPRSTVRRAMTPGVLSSRSYAE
jgi:hypothetical protein